MSPIPEVPAWVVVVPAAGAAWRSAAQAHEDGGQQDKRRGPPEWRNLVITPGGPRPPKNVHRVHPGEIVRQNPDGSFSIVPKDKPRDPHHKRGGDGFEGGAAK